MPCLATTMLATYTLDCTYTGDSHYRVKDTLTINSDITYNKTYVTHDCRYSQDSPEFRYIQGHSIFMHRYIYHLVYVCHITNAIIIQSSIDYQLN